MNDPLDFGPESEMFFQMLKNREQVIVGLVNDVNSCTKNMHAFEKLERLYETNPDGVSTWQALKACAKSLRHLNEVNRKLMMLLIPYVAGKLFTEESTNILLRTGRGEDALQEALRQKGWGK